MPTTDFLNDLREGWADYFANPSLKRSAKKSGAPATG